MLTTILLDLDDTLVRNDMNSFMPSYFAALSRHFAQQPYGDRLLDVLLAAARKIRQKQDAAQTNAELLWEHLDQQLQDAQPTLRPLLDRFYREIFPSLQSVSEFIPAAPRLVDYCFDADLRVVIATNPLYPAVAIEERLRWAGVPADRYDYALITSYDNMHWAKPSPNYYREILEEVGEAPRRCLMVGDGWANDMLPSSSVGLNTYWLPTPALPQPPDPSLVDGYGSLEQLLLRLQSGWLQSAKSETLHDTERPYSQSR